MNLKEVCKGDAMNVHLPAAKVTWVDGLDKSGMQRNLFC